MNPEEIQNLLNVRRPGGQDDRDPQIAAALQQLQHDPALARRFAAQKAFDETMTEGVRQIPVPARLKGAILAERVLIRPVAWWRRPVPHFAAAAAVLMLAALVGLWFESRPAQFGDYRQELVEGSLNQFPRPDFESSDLKQVRQWLAANQAEHKFVVPSALFSLPLRGGKILEWQGRKISVICFGDGVRQVQLFVTNGADFSDAPPQGSPDFDTHGGWRTASWSQGDQTYVVRGMSSRMFVKKFRKPGQWLISS